MYNKNSLRYRIALAFASIGGIVTFLLALIVFITTQNLNQRLMDETLNAELKDFVARRQRNPQSIPPNANAIHGYVLANKNDQQQLPEPLRSLSLGNHEIWIGKMHYRVAIADNNGVRFLLLFNEQLHDERERRFLLSLLVGVIAMIVLSAWSGWWLAGRVTSPVLRLTEAVRHAKPGKRTNILSDEFLNDEVGELANAFDHYLDQLALFIERERAFTADASHELRTPLAIIQGAVEVMEEDEQLSEFHRIRLSRIRRATQEAVEMITALLSLAREETQASDESTCDVVSVVNQVIDRNRHLLRQKPVLLKTDFQITLTLVAQPILLHVVVSNLLRNAFAFTESGEISISIEPNRIRISDTGLGIPSAESGNIFQRYYKGSTSRGSGIGLSLVKRICVRYGWDISIESQEGMGTVAQLIFTTPAPL